MFLFIPHWRSSVQGGPKPFVQDQIWKSLGSRPREALWVAQKLGRDLADTVRSLQRMREQGRARLLPDGWVRGEKPVDGRTQQTASKTIPRPLPMTELERCWPMR